MKKTIIAIKLRGSQTTRDLLNLAKVLGVFALFFLVFFGVQVAFCRASYPEMPWKKCAFPRFGLEVEP